MGSAWGCMGGSSSAASPKAAPRPAAAPKTNDADPAWTKETADKLQEAVDQIFGTSGNSLLGLDFSFSIADPFIAGCPLIGCSTGFTTLCGYELKDIVGRNCRFLVEPVPPEQTDKIMRKHTKDWCEAVRLGKDYRRPDTELEDWMPRNRPVGELIAMQRNARKDGTLFNNLFYMKIFGLSSDLGQERPYIVALQSELVEGKNDLLKISEKIQELDLNMERVSKALSSLFFMTAHSISRQKHAMSPAWVDLGESSMFPSAVGSVAEGSPEKGDWTPEMADKLQESVDNIFGTADQALLSLEFSFSIADPSLAGCPLIGCSTGFTKLCGYGLEEIVGRNCRFLLDPVPADQVDKITRKHTKDFCEAVACGEEYRIPSNELESWMPLDRPSDELFAMQKNARKDGTFFYNLFYLKAFCISADVSQDKPFIVALQSELPDGKEDLSRLATNLEVLDRNMARVRQKLAASFFVGSSLSRQLNRSASPPDSKTSTQEAPKDLHSPFKAPADVEPWDEKRFKFLRKLADASRNRGVVKLMHDQSTDQKMAVKKMPNSWIGTCHEDFVKMHPNETEMPWEDIGCTRFLNNVNYKHACQLQGVYRGKDDTYVVSSLASEGDLFGIAGSGGNPSPKREEEMAPIVLEFLSALRQLHHMQIAHRDISLENVLQSKDVDGKTTLRIIDFGMASTTRKFLNAPRGKASYEAPEMRIKDKPYDAFLSDTFAAGVVVYSIFLKDYPWMSTKRDQCKCFEYVRENGFRKYCEMRAIRGSQQRIASATTPELMSLLEGLLAIDPSKRLTLGEKQWTDNRKSVWDEPWVKARTGKQM